MGVVCENIVLVFFFYYRKRRGRRGGERMRQNTNRELMKST